VFEFISLKINDWKIFKQHIRWPIKTNSCHDLKSKFYEK